MKSVVFSGSLRHAREMEEWAVELQKNGIKVYFPVKKQPLEWNELSESERRRLQRRFIDEHNQAIDTHDVLFVFNPEGKIGNSVTLEVGYALAKNKPIYAMNMDVELGRDVLFLDYCRTPQNLVELLKS